MKTFNDETYQKRQLELSNRMIESNCDLCFCPPSSDLEYLTGTLRRKPTFGNISYTHGWVCGAFFRPFKNPLFVLPRMVAEFDMPHGATGEKIIINKLKLMLENKGGGSSINNNQMRQIDYFRDGNAQKRMKSYITTLCNSQYNKKVERLDYSDTIYKNEYGLETIL